MHFINPRPDICQAQQKDSNKNNILFIRIGIIYMYLLCVLLPIHEIGLSEGINCLPEIFDSYYRE